ncbi:MAG: bifunctional enoyl-CoA hydratase/phosphate acetyltransferase [Acidimicrobiales bacterium]
MTPHAPMEKTTTEGCDATNDRPAEGAFRLHGYFGRLLARCRDLPPLRVAVVYPVDPPALLGALDASRAGIVRPVLVGPARQMAATAEAAGVDISGFTVVEAPDEASAAAEGVAAVRDGQADLLMKGSLHTSTFLHAVVERGSGLRGPRRASHVFVFDVPAYDRPLLVTDAVVNVAPGLSEKADICRNAVDLAHVLGIERPKVAVLSAIEVVDPAIPSTSEAAAVAKMADRGEIEGALVDGPLALDDAISPDAVATKHITSAIGGEADILLVPNLEAGNILYKSLTHLARADVAGIVLGTRVPLVLTSRADTVHSRVGSAALATLWSARPGAGSRP